MRLLVDSLPCQTPSRHRGIGRYTLSLLLEMAKLPGSNQLSILANAHYPESLEELRQQFIRLLPSGSFLPYFHESVANRPRDKAHNYIKIAETNIEYAYQVISPDIVLTPSLFEGWGGGEHGMVPLPGKHHPHQLRAAILYDLIPLIFQKQYLDPNPTIKEWYLERIGILHNFDLLLAISEATRQDAINILGISPSKVVNISGAASSHFKKMHLSEKQRQQFLHRLGISRPYVLYIGGNDFRKNMEGSIRAYAKLPQEIINTHQLVLNDVGDEFDFRRKASKLGLDEEDLVIIKRITDEDLILLYNLCKLFIFPSLYEGFGLPVLEAMSCGAPVLASNNSSLPEVVGREDALFDVSDEQAIAKSIHKVLTKDDYRTDLAEYGLKNARNFSWEKSAKRAWKALESTYRQNKIKNDQNEKFSITESHRRLKIAYVSPLPPQKSGIADYSAALLPYLAEIMDIDLFTQPGLQVTNKYQDYTFSVFSWDELHKRKRDYDTIIYHMGNSEFHIPFIDLIKDNPGVVVNHDFYHSNLPFVKEIRSGEKGIFFNAMDKSHGLLGLLDYLKIGMEAARWKWPINWDVLKAAQVLVVHSEHQKELLKKFYDYGWKPNPVIIKQLRESVPKTSRSQRKQFRKELGLDPCTFIYCSFGFMAPTKLNNQTIEAFSRVLQKVDTDTELIFVGDLEGGEYGIETKNLIKKLNLNHKIHITGYVKKEDYKKYLACVDVAVQLRTNSRGETSRAVLDCMAYGLPTIVNNHGSLQDYDDNDVVKLTESPSLDELMQAMIRLQTEDSFRKEKSQRSRKYVLEKHDPQKIAADYAEVINRAAHISEHKTFSPLIDAIFEMGSPASLVQSSASYAARNKTLRCQPRILIDVTDFEDDYLESSDKGKASKIIKGWLAQNDPAVKLELVFFRDDQLMRASRNTEELCDLPEHSLGVERTINIQPGDMLVMFSSHLLSTYPSPKIYEMIRQKGGKVITVLQDTLGKLLDTPAVESDMFLCVTRAIAEESSPIIDSNELNNSRSMDLYFFHPEANDPQNWEKSIQWFLNPRDNRYIINQREDHIQESQLGTCTQSESANQLNKQPEQTSETQKSPPDQSDKEKDTVGKYIPSGEEMKPISPTPTGNEAAIRKGLLRSSACSQEMLESDRFQKWVERMKGRKMWMHRKLWEWSFISQAFYERGLLKPGRRGLGFAVGQEPLPALFASYGCEIVATDLSTAEVCGKDWMDTNQHAAGLHQLNKAQICPDDLFNERVSFRFVDMNQIDEDLRGFDFLWSSCAMEHLGSLEHGKQFIYNAMQCLKPGGFAVHTTEFNISSNQDTLAEGADVIYRKRDLEEIGNHLRAEGHNLDLDFSLGEKPFDLKVDTPPYQQDVHLRLELGGYTCTSYGLIIEKESSI